MAGNRHSQPQVLGGIFVVIRGRILGLLAGAVAAAAALLPLILWRNSDDALLTPRPIGTASVMSGQIGAHSPVELARGAAIRQANVLVSKPATPNALTVYAECKAAEILAAKFTWSTHGAARLDALNAFLESEGGLSDTSEGDLTPCHDEAIGAIVERDANASPEVHAGAIRLALWRLVPLSRQVVNAEITTGAIKPIQNAFREARQLFDRIEGHWAAYQRIVKEPSLQELLGRAEVEVLRTHVAKLQPSAAIATEMDNRNQLGSDATLALAKQLVQRRVKPWSEIVEATKAVADAYGKVASDVESGIKRVELPSSAHRAMPAGRIVLGKGEGHCVVGELKQGVTADLGLALYLLVPSETDQPKFQCSDSSLLPSGGWRRYALGLEYVNVTLTANRALSLPRGPRPILRDVSEERGAVLRDLLLPTWASERASQWTVRGDPLAGNLEVASVIQVSVPPLGMSYSFSLSLGVGARDIKRQAESLIGEVRDSVHSLAPANLRIADLPFSIRRFDVAEGLGWTHSALWVQAEVVVPNIGNGVVRLELREGKLALATQTLSEQWRSLVETAGTAALRRAAKGGVGPYSIVVVDGRLEPPGVVHAVLRLTSSTPSVLTEIPDLKLTADMSGLSISPASGTWLELVARLSGLRQGITESARQYANALISRGFKTSLSGLEVIARATRSTACSEGFDLVINGRLAIQCVVANDAGVNPTLDFSHAQLVKLPSGEPADPAQLIVSALGISNMRVGQFRASVTAAASDGLRISVFLDGIPRIGSVCLGEVAIGPTSPSWKSTLTDQFRSVLLREFSAIVRPVLSAQLGPVDVEAVDLAIESSGVKFSTDLIAKLDVTGLGQVPIPVKATWLPSFELHAGDAKQQLVAVLQGAAGTFLGTLGDGSELKPKVRLEPLSVSLTPTVNLGGAKFSLTLSVSQKGVRAQTPLELPLGVPITIPPVAIVNPRIRINDDQLRALGIAGDITALSPGVDTLAKIQASLDLKLTPIRAEFSGDLVLVSVLPIANVHALLADSRFTFEVTSSEALSSILALKGQGEISPDVLYANGSFGVLGVTLGDARIEAILCESCPTRGNLNARGSVNLLLGRADAAVETNVKTNPFPNNPRFSSQVSFQVDRFEISNARVAASDTEASIQLTALGVPLTVQGRTLSDLTPARVLEAILAIFKMDPSKLIEALKNPQIDFGKPVGPRANGGGTPGQPQRGGGESDARQSQWGSSSGDGTEQPNLVPGPVRVRFHATQFPECTVRVPTFFGSDDLLPTDAVDSLKRNLTIGIIHADSSGILGTPNQLAAAATTAIHTVFPLQARGVGGPWALTLTPDGKLTAVRTHVTHNCGSKDASTTQNVVPLTLTPNIMIDGWDWRAARMGAKGHAVTSGDMQLFKLALNDALHNDTKMEGLSRIDLENGASVYRWKQPQADRSSRLMLLSRAAWTPWAAPETSLLSGLNDPDQRRSWPWFPPIADGFKNGQNPGYLWPVVGAPKLVEVGSLVWACGDTGCQPIRMLGWRTMEQLRGIRRFDNLAEVVAQVAQTAPPSPADSMHAKAAMWLGAPPGTSLPVAVYSPDLTASKYEVYVADSATKSWWRVTDTAIASAGRTRGLECGIDLLQDLTSERGRIALLRQLGEPLVENPRCVSPWFFWKSLRTP